MEQEKDYQSMPANYLLCYNEKCELADTCLWQLAAKHGNTNNTIVQAVNPKLNNGNSCQFFRQKKTVRMAYGMIHIYERVLTTDIVSLRNTISSHFGNGSYYLRRNGKLRITPAEQQFINETFHAHGYPEDVVFDSYADEIDW